MASTLEAEPLYVHGADDPHPSLEDEVKAIPGQSVLTSGTFSRRHTKQMHSACGKRLCSQDSAIGCVFQRTTDCLEKNQDNRTGGLFLLDFLPLIWARLTGSVQMPL